MTEVIIDTNVAVVANRQNNEVSLICQEASIRHLVEVLSNNIVLVDGSGEVIQEYQKALSLSRPAGLGGLFLMRLLQEQYNPDKVRRVQLEKTKSGDYVDFPDCHELGKFDRDDRKFAALARNTGVAVSNATDSDWLNFRSALKANGIHVNFVCGCDKSSWFT